MCIVTFYIVFKNCSLKQPKFFVGTPAAMYSTDSLYNFLYIESFPGDIETTKSAGQDVGFDPESGC